MKKIILTGLLVSLLSGCATSTDNTTATTTTSTTKLVQRGPAIWEPYKRECGGGSVVKAAMFNAMGLYQSSIDEQRRITGNNQNCRNITAFMVQNNIPFPPKE
jgi:hypothetical protein